MLVSWVIRLLVQSLPFDAGDLFSPHRPAFLLTIRQGGIKGGKKSSEGLFIGWRICCRQIIKKLRMVHDFQIKLIGLVLDAIALNVIYLSVTFIQLLKSVIASGKKFVIFL